MRLRAARDGDGKVDHDRIIAAAQLDGQQRFGPGQAKLSEARLAYGRAGAALVARERSAEPRIGNDVRSHDERRALKPLSFTPHAAS